MHHPALRYAELKPAGVEGNHFMYHLRQLMRSGHVVKRPDGQYELSRDGKLHADGLSHKSLKLRRQPRIVTLVVCRNAKGEWLFVRRHRQPLLDMAGFPYGKIHLGETVVEAAHRELMEKTGLTANLVHRGDGYITIHQHGEPVSQIMFHLFCGDDPQGQLRDSLAGPVFWAPLSAADESYMPSVPDLIDLLEKPAPGRFFVELTYDLKSQTPRRLNA